MCGRSFRGYGSGLAAWRQPWRVHGPRQHGGPRGFFGLDAGEVGTGARISASLAVLVPAALVAVVVLASAPQLLWLLFVFGWTLFPALGLLAGGVAEVAQERRSQPRPQPAKSQERELLEALREHGELTPARAAMESSLSVKEADGMLRELAEGGHLEVRARGGGLFYALWGPADAVRELEPPGYPALPRTREG